MYSRYPNRTPRPSKLPENYSGNAFRKEPPPETVDRPCPPDPPPPPPPMMALLPKPDRKPPHPERPPHGQVGSLLENIQFEEALLIGLILLLAGSDQSSDLTMMLALLLLCG